MTGHRKRKNDFMEPLLRAWYGREQGKAEMLRYTPETCPLSESLEKVMKQLIPPGERKIMQIREQWEEIAGPENARRCVPSFLNNGIFYIEVSHPAYRVALETPLIKQRMLERIQAIAGKEMCQTIKFIAGGRSAPRTK